MINYEFDREVGNNDFSDTVKTYYQELKRYNPLSKKCERELMVKAKAGDIKARNKILSSNLRFVFDIAKKYRGHGVEISELISEGNKGMIKAIDKFDLEQGVKFYSYAVWWIRQAMISAINEHVEKCTIETSFEDVFKRGEDDDICENIYNDEIDDYHDNTNDITEDNINYMELNEENEQKHFVVEKLLAKLDDRERVIIQKYFGIEKDDDGQNLDEISKELNLSTERVRQLKVKAINEMRAEVFDLREADFLFC